MTTLYADVIVDISREALDRPFSYIVPEELRERIAPGSVVRVPFGKGGRLIRGFVIRLSGNCGYEPEKMKEIAEAVTDDETSEGKLIALASWMSRTYGGAEVLALKTVLPAKKKIGGHYVRRVSLTDTGRAREYLRGLSPRYTGRIRVIEILMKAGMLPVPELLEKAQVSVSVVRSLEKDGIICILETEEYRKVVHEAEMLPADQLTEEQEKAVSYIKAEWKGSNRPFLLTGVTGSGKTLVYMEMIAEILEEGRQAIVLIPEIALTRQTVLRFVRRFGESVSFLNSRLSAGEKYDQMKAAKRGDVSIMVGPRSALFTPFPKLGLIIIDEEQEETYHSETAPRYHARDTAIERAALENAHVIMGSATPSMRSSFCVRNGTYAGTFLKNRYGNAVLPETQIVDMRKEMESGSRSIFSGVLLSEMRACLERKEQIMLFLNRRGYAGYVACRSCGFVVKCPHCDVSLTQHINGRLICHYCGFEMPELKECPECGSKYIGGFSVGTEQVEESVRREFPEARVLRMDMDTTRGKEGHSSILKAFDEGRADILVGTQMIVKGHDFPSVTLVGVLMADLSLNESDYRSAEHTFQLITQAVGRAGRGKKKGKAVIQTYHPEHYAVQCASAQDYEGFYKEEIAFRTIMDYPPVGTLLAVLGSSTDERLLTTGMMYIRKYIDRLDPKKTLYAIGPAPQAVGKIKDHFREAIYLRSDDPEKLIRARKFIEEYLKINKGFAKINIQFDFNV